MYYNLAITTDCDKHCPYCFAKGRTGEMSLDFIKQTIDSLPENAPVRVLGGEPTMHPQFAEILGYAAEQGRHIDLFSNLLFRDAAILQAIIDAAGRTNLAVLANATDLNVGPRREQWLQNYRALTGKVLLIKPGLTLVRGQDYGEYVEDILSNIQTEYLRVSMALPSDDDCLGDTAYGAQFIAVNEICRSHGVKMTVDCVLYPCMFDGTPDFPLNTKCGRPPADLLPDGSVIYCFPLAGRISAGFEPGMTMALRAEYERALSEAVLPAKCQSCSHLGTSCDGPALCHSNQKP